MRVNGTSHPISIRLAVCEFLIWRMVACARNSSFCKLTVITYAGLTSLIERNRVQVTLHINWRAGSTHERSEPHVPNAKVRSYVAVLARYRLPTAALILCHRSRLLSTFSTCLKS